MARVKINASICTGCRNCEVVCSLHHFKEANPMKSRIRIYQDAEQRINIPIIAGPFTEAQCTNKTIKMFGDLEIDGCALCPVSSCPSRHIFTDPETGVSLKCDMCGEDPPDPWCVKSCAIGALTLVDDIE